jgi:ABC-2 type transport system ATP-binding protein
MRRSVADGAGQAVAELTGVSKFYGPVMALNEVTLRLEPGITGLVGPNGAGKSTLIRLLTGQLRPGLGRVRVCGRDAWRASAKAHIGYCADADAFYEEMSGRQFVRLMARLHGLHGAAARQRTELVLEEVGMADRADRPLAGYSKGMRQRIKLAQALIHDPDLLVLDEPLNGVDPLGRIDLLDQLRQIADRGKAVLVSSHILDEMDRLAQRVLFLCRGRLIASGTLAEVREMLDDHPLRVCVVCNAPRTLAARLALLPTVHGIRMQGSGRLILQVQPPREFFPVFGELASREEFEIQRLEILDASTGAVFDYLMQASRPGGAELP